MSCSNHWFRISKLLSWHNALQVARQLGLSKPTVHLLLIPSFASPPHRLPHIFHISLGPNFKSPNPQIRISSIVFNLPEYSHSLKLHTLIPVPIPSRPIPTPQTTICSYQPAQHQSSLLHSTQTTAASSPVPPLPHHLPPKSTEDTCSNPAINTPHQHLTHPPTMSNQPTSFSDFEDLSIVVVKDTPNSPSDPTTTHFTENEEPRHCRITTSRGLKSKEKETPNIIGQETLELYGDKPAESKTESGGRKGRSKGLAIDIDIAKAYSPYHALPIATSEGGAKAGIEELHSLSPNSNEPEDELTVIGKSSDSATSSPHMDEKVVTSTSGLLCMDKDKDKGFDLGPVTDDLRVGGLRTVGGSYEAVAAGNDWEDKREEEDVIEIPLNGRGSRGPKPTSPTLRSTPDIVDDLPSENYVDWDNGNCDSDDDEDESSSASSSLSENLGGVKIASEMKLDFVVIDLDDYKGEGFEHSGRYTGITEFDGSGCGDKKFMTGFVAREEIEGEERIS
ncbi:hypothetical protein BKA64DRAFT_42024 [Cadophora sp. MPI-SDFR-AT-0126]|nr:hypothetical protein BKA64DRAFT_42024 [Leotiomycetes sp. MPI-SDFR-AT-0126]